MENKFITKIETCPAEGIFMKNETIPAANLPENQEWGIVNFFDDVVYQEVIGFGGAFTESSAYLYSLLSAEDKKRFLELYFSREKGIGYNFGRSHINSCDFSLDIYADVEEGDETLETFSLAREKKYILPLLKDAIEYSGEEIVLFASPWSPPAYMKTTKNMVEGGKLSDEYKALWAKFYTRYIKAMADEGVKISAITIQNEPLATQPWESCCYTPEDEAEFIDKYLIDALDEAGLSDVKIMIWDHNKERVYDRARTILANPRVNERVWAVSYHWYTGDHFEGLRLVHEKFGKPLVSSEFCGVIKEDVNHLAENYGVEICENFNNFQNASCDWNLMLNEYGGPYHNRNRGVKDNDREDKNSGCYAPILYDTEKNELQVTPIYYYIGHFSKYVQRGAKRVATTKHSRWLYTCGFVNPDGSKVCVIINTAEKSNPAFLRYNGESTKLEMKPHSVVTLIF